LRKTIVENYFKKSDSYMKTLYENYKGIKNEPARKNEIDIYMKKGKKRYPDNDECLISFMKMSKQ
jgi:hypothetical protein